MNTSELPEYMTGFKMSKAVNEALGTSLPPQMFYQYISKGTTSTSPGYIQSVTNAEGKRVVTRDEVVRWTKQYAAKKGLQLVLDDNQLAIDFETAAAAE